ncbi:sterol desaturase family protein [Oceanihabitans sediminis]|uniref:Sterol desaturase family protein n=1 Tax=Oceanihabitans sediminis TaxID=1812012 RepID=A0A368P8P8_9FLAO|nr:sterol desaturase family protein [Oceanihabitans sediminis]MDX1279136.1 sterol desaturase family protein [Oceanihabitans sediminis]MDX1773950.1 sterol desaturase family protein [Oceanihabitans sediminis]RBP32024.1 sterol desaturase/sphingolipid hydroxylase (fatty acid hydroxylase superfamily) [Oceanihabitans sediminis]RCU58680.1 sterol desaturase family protein [Oceanihabitans sediminis]
MEKYVDIIKNSYSDYWNYIKQSVLMELNWENYFYGLIIISLVVWALEAIFPWRKNQSLFRKDFWLDTFYMFFNFFILNLIVLIALSNSAAELFNDVLGLVGLSVSSFQVLDINELPFWLRILIFFIVIDFVQWWTHRLLHKSDFLWNFHKVHHSVKEMGFAAHLRYHWMEPVVYNSLKYIPLAIIGGFSAQDVALVHFFNITIGHLNHANIGWDYGILKYVFNNPKMHIWHHSKELPEDRRYGVNFGITLSLWDYIFKTDYIPYDGRDIELGFEGDETFPEDFVSQELYPLKK